MFKFFSLNFYLIVLVFYYLCFGLAVWFWPNVFVLATLYVLFLMLLKLICYKFQKTQKRFMNFRVWASLLVWSVIFAFLTSGYFFLEGWYYYFFVNLYFVFMAYIGLTGFSILIFDKTILPAIKYTALGMLRVFNRNQMLLFLIVWNLLLQVNFHIKDIVWIWPLLALFVTYKYFRVFKV